MSSGLMHINRLVVKARTSKASKAKYLGPNAKNLHLRAKAKNFAFKVTRTHFRHLRLVTYIMHTIAHTNHAHKDYISAY